MSRRSVLIVIACLAWPMLLSGAAVAQSAADQFKGSWELVSIRYVKPDGSAVEPFGPQARGMLVFDGAHFATQVMAANLPKFASNNRMIGTSQEYEAISRGVVAYYGTYTVSEADRIVTLHIERSSFPNWEGTDQQRKFEFSGDELRYTAATSSANPAEAAQLV